MRRGAIGPPPIGHPLLDVATFVTSVLLQSSLEAKVCLFHIELQFSNLIVWQILGSLHLVQIDQPLNYLSLAFKVLVSDFVDSVNEVHEERVKRILPNHANPDSVEESDKVFCSLHYVGRVGGIALLRAGLL